MKLSLQLKLGQQLTMTPQLQQAIKLLQLSTLDLQQEIHQALESNPMLELIENSDEDESGTSQESNTQSADKSTSENSEKTSERNSEQPTDEQVLNGDDSNWQEEMPGDLAVDSNWDDIYPSTYSASNSYDSDSIDYESRNTTVDTLQDHLLWQLNLTPMSEKDKSIGLAIIDAIDANGMLTVGVESMNAGFESELEIELDEIVAVLHRIQQFDPIGVGYRDLSECLSIQLNQIDDSNFSKLIT